MTVVQWSSRAQILSGKKEASHLNTEFPAIQLLCRQEEMDIL